ncbi:MAG: hypothetical protein Q9195_008623 [Heterodermia aff. obscurata]
MDHHSKRRRLRYDDPDAELYEKRARNDLHLKSRFEAIFEKFGKDFSEVADEIDMETGTIVVNKGHLVGMAHEQDIGQAIDPSSQQLPRHKIAIEDLGGSLMNRAMASSTVDSTTESLLGSDTDMEDLTSDSAVDLLDRGPSQNAGSNSPELSSQQYPDLKHGRTQSPEPDETPLRRLNVDSILDRLHPRQLTMYDSPIEPAWQAPSLPIDAIAQVQGPISTPRWSEENEKRRSASPNLGSLWTPFPSRWPAKNKVAAMYGRKVTSKMRRSSMPAMTTKEAGSGHPKHPISKAAPPEPWTFREESLLRQLRTNTKLTFHQMVPYFTGRTAGAIRFHWYQVLLPGHSRHQEYWATNPGPTVIVANVDDTDVDELQAYDYVFQPSKTVVQSKKIREPSPNAFLSEQEVPTSPCPTAQLSKTVVQSKKIREPSSNAFLSEQEVPTSPCSTTQVPFEDFLDSLREHSRSECSEVKVHSSPSVAPQTPQESYPAAKIYSYQRSTSTADPSPEPEASVAAFAASSPSPILTARDRKEHVSPDITTLALNTPCRLMYDLSEDELATPINVSRNTNLARVSTKSKKSTASPKLQSLNLESGSEDELSTPVQQRIVPKGFRKQKGASQRRKSSFW